ncbi:MAG: threonine--tRNA ligase [Candidatus Shikimatogenerans bostrichidophilus]|nr:MAG: threonine--tRNA ligase [Candidatus Shikimatogenerans bostrichidophilus]
MESNNIYDHKKIGKNLKLFFFYKNLNTGLPIWLPLGIYIYNRIKKIIKVINCRNNYNEVFTPLIGSYNIYNKSGHIKNYLNNIFQILYKKKIYLKPMNCPYHCLIYKNYNNLSYKLLPIKFFEFGTVFRNEKSGEINGLFRTKMFTQDDGHIFCKNSIQVIKEINNLINIILYIYKKFNFKSFFIRLSLRKSNGKNKYIGKKQYWDKAERILKEIIKKRKIKYKISYGEAAFYGPKIDFIIKDSYKRNWQISTIQIDYNTPKKFNLTYINKYNEIKYPIMIHRALIGSLERFIGILLEHTKGNLPIWLLKIQIIIIPIFIKNHYLYVKDIYKKLTKKKIRICIDKTKSNLNKKIKKYDKLKIPIILIVGDYEIRNKSVYIRHNKQKNNMKLKDAYKYIYKYIYNN